MKVYPPRSAVILRVALPLAIAAIALCSSCKKQASGDDLLVPGHSAMGIEVRKDDSASIVRKLGMYDKIATMQFGGRMFMYGKLGIGFQFGGRNSIYYSPLNHDSTVTQIVLFNEQTLDDKKILGCRLLTKEGLGMKSSPLDFIKAWGEAPFLQKPIDKRIDENFTGALFYPGLLVGFRNGAPNTMYVRYMQSPNPEILKKVVSQPIVANQEAGGIKLGMSLEEVRAILGTTYFKYKKMDADFWFYPEYAIKIQFGIPPIEGAPTSAFADSTLTGKVTAITVIGKKVYEGELCPAGYVGTTAQGVTPGMPVAEMRAKLGEPKQFVGITTTMGGMPYYLYPGLVAFVDGATETVNHISVTKEGYPLDAPGQ
jgi:hypothetical protein